MCPLTPFPDERQLHSVQVLGLIREDHLRGVGRNIDIVEALVDEIGEIHEAARPFIPRPFFRELAQYQRPSILRNHQPAKLAQLLQHLVAVLGCDGVLGDCAILAVEFALLSDRRKRQARILAVPLVHAGFRYHRFAQGVITK